MYERTLVVLLQVQREQVQVYRGTGKGTEGHRYRYRVNLRNMYESVTPNPTGSLSGPYFLQDTGGTVTGTEGAQSQV
jgi:hypothetical protein